MIQIVLILLAQSISISMYKTWLVIRNFAQIVSEWWHSFHEILLYFCWQCHSCSHSHCIKMDRMHVKPKRTKTFTFSHLYMKHVISQWYCSFHFKSAYGHGWICTFSSEQVHLVWLLFGYWLLSRKTYG